MIRQYISLEKIMFKDFFWSYFIHTYSFINRSSCVQAFYIATTLQWSERQWEESNLFKNYKGNHFQELGEIPKNLQTLQKHRNKKKHSWNENFYLIFVTVSFLFLWLVFAFREGEAILVWSIYAGELPYLAPSFLEVNTGVLWMLTTFTF